MLGLLPVYIHEIVLSMSAEYYLSCTTVLQKQARNSRLSSHAHGHASSLKDSKMLIASMGSMGVSIGTVICGPTYAGHTLDFTISKKC